MVFHHWTYTGMCTRRRSRSGGVGSVESQWATPSYHAGSRTREVQTRQGDEGAALGLEGSCCHEAGDQHGQADDADEHLRADHAPRHQGK